MKLLHTSDWHVGKALRGRSRLAEHEAVLGEIITAADAERVDIVIVGGDLFDTAAPPPEAERIVYSTLLALAETGARVLVIGGNHDHPRRLDAVAPLVAAAGITVLGAPRSAADGGVVRVECRSGEAATVALLPFAPQRQLVRAADLLGTDAHEHRGSYKHQVAGIIKALAGAFAADTVNIVAAHLYAIGASLGGGERPSQVGLDYGVDSTAFPASAHYVALGHLHRQQRIAAGVPVWYCGSPLQLDFGEEAHDKAALIVEATAKTPATTRPVPLTGGRRLRTLRGTMDELEALAGTTGEDFLRVMISGATRSGLADGVRALFPEAVDVMVEHTERPDAGSEGPSRTGRSPHDLFADYLRTRGVDDPPVLDLFDELLEEASGAA